MSKADFLSCENLLAMFCTNRKKTVCNGEINWFTFRKIGYRKGLPMQLFFETYDDVGEKYAESVEFHQNLIKTLSVAKRGLKTDEFIQFELPLLYPEGRAIATNKKVDLLELLDLIPVEHRSFYTTLNHSENDLVLSQLLKFPMMKKTLTN